MHTNSGETSTGETGAMHLDAHANRKTEGLTKQVCSQKNCTCCGMDIEDPGRVRYYPRDKVNQCLGNREECKHRSYSSVDVYLCRCPVRGFIAELLI